MFAFLIILSSSAFADQHADDQVPAGREKKVDQLKDKLTLTDDQKNKIQASREKYRAQILEKESAYNTAKDKFTAMIQNPNSTSTDLEALYKTQEDAHRALQDTLFQSRMEFRDILTPEQRTKMAVKREDKARGRAGSKPMQPVPPPPPVPAK